MTNNFNVGDRVSMIFPNGIRRTGHIDFASSNPHDGHPYQVNWDNYSGDENYLWWSGSKFSLVEQHNDK